MEIEEFREILNTRRVYPQIDMNGPLQDGMAALFEQMIIHPSNPDEAIPHVRFLKNPDKNVRKQTINYSFIGDTMTEVITRIINEYPVQFVAIPNEEGGFELMLEYYEREFFFDEVEAHKYERRKHGCTHSKQRVSNAVHR